MTTRPIDSFASAFPISSPEATTASESTLWQIASLHMLQRIIEPLLAVKECPSPSFPHFWDSWTRFAEKIPTYSLIAERKKQILENKEEWRPYIEQAEANDPAFYHRIRTLLETGSLKPIEQGMSGTYLLLDLEGVPQYILKPSDEEMFCLNNHKHHGTPLGEGDIQGEFPLYRTAQAGTLSYLIAERLHLTNITPKTALICHENPIFFDICDTLSFNEKQDFIEKTGPVDREKLCCIQEYLPHTADLFSWILSHDQAATPPIDERDFEDANLFLWMTYDLDGHPENFLLSPSRSHDSYHLHKIDNARTFPERNHGFSNILAFLPQAELPLSAYLRDKLTNIPISSILEDMEKLGFTKSQGALMERVHLLLHLAKQPDISLYEINLRMMILGQPGGKEVAYENLPIKELEKQLQS